MAEDAIFAALLKLREEEPGEERRYIREAFYRKDLGIPQVKPQVWFKAPRDWEPSANVEKVHTTLEEENAS